MKNGSTVFASTFWRDERGSVFLELTVTAGVFFVVLFGIVEFSYMYYQWNAATKAVQLGARLAAISNPISSDLTTLTGLSGSVFPGDAMPAFDRVCSGATATCTSGTYSAAAMNALVYGRGGGTSCSDTGSNMGMCDVFNRIRPQNVIVRYQYTGLGYAGRPGGPVPTISVSLTNIPFNFLFLNGLLGLAPITIPGLRTTITGEDLKGN